MGLILKELLVSVNNLLHNQLLNTDSIFHSMEGYFHFYPHLSVEFQTNKELRLPFVQFLILRDLEPGFFGVVLFIILVDVLQKIHNEKVHF